MFKPHIANCLNCKCKRVIPTKRGLCGICLAKHKQRGKSKVNRIVRQFKRREPTGELNLFKQLWDFREHKSELSGKQISFFNINCFAHILPKGLYKDWRLKPGNIIIITHEEHWQQHHGTLPPKLKFKFNLLYNQLKSQYYYEQTQTNNPKIS